MELNLFISLAALIIGFTVGLTGMGGGALMTPVLLLVFGIDPGAAVASDLVAAMIMKPIGGGVHIRRKTVHWELVRWLAIGSVPAAFIAVFLLHSLADPDKIANITKTLLGITLMLAAAAMIFKSWLQSKRNAAMRAQGLDPYAHTEIKVRRVPTLVVGVVGGTLVGLTSVGSGSIIIVCLMMLYPSLRGAELVGTDLVQAIPLVAAAALAHMIIGDFVVGLTASILIGAIPGVYVGARLSSKAPDGVIRPALIYVLLASGLKLVGLSTPMLGVYLVAFPLVALPIWGAIDAARRPESEWEATGLNRGTWVGVQAIGAFFLVGFFAAIGYFWRKRPALQAVAAVVPERVAA
jgi:hypothetical protein